MRIRINSALVRTYRLVFWIIWSQGSRKLGWKKVRAVTTPRSAWLDLAVLMNVRHQAYSNSLLHLVCDIAWNLHFRSVFTMLMLLICFPLLSLARDLAHVDVNIWLLFLTILLSVLLALYQLHQTFGSKWVQNSSFFSFCLLYPYSAKCL